MSDFLDSDFYCKQNAEDYKYFVLKHNKTAKTFVFL